jgi:transposase-like protein
MAHGQNAKITNGKDWWGKRPITGIAVSRKKSMKFWKKILHKIERRTWKKNENTH